MQVFKQFYISNLFIVHISDLTQFIEVYEAY